MDVVIERVWLRFVLRWQPIRPNLQCSCLPGEAIESIWTV